jgi:hypothetical protein
MNGGDRPKSDMSRAVTADEMVRLLSRIMRVMSAMGKTTVHLAHNDQAAALRNNTEVIELLDDAITEFRTFVGQNDD